MPDIITAIIIFIVLLLVFISYWRNDTKPEEAIEHADEAKNVYKVFIRDLNSNVREEMMELSDDNIKQFVDKKSCAYAQQFFEDGEPKLLFLTKDAWNKTN